MNIRVGSILENKMMIVIQYVRIYVVAVYRNSAESDIGCIGGK